MSDCRKDGAGVDVGAVSPDVSCHPSSGLASRRLERALRQTVEIPLLRFHAGHGRRPPIVKGKP